MTIRVVTEIPLPEYGGQAVFLDGKWTVIPSKHNAVVKNKSNVIVKQQQQPLEALSPSKKTNEIPLISRQSSKLLRSASKVAEMEARNSSPIPRSPESRKIGTPQKGVSYTEKTGRGGLQAKRSLEVKGSFNEDDPVDKNYQDPNESIGYTCWKNNFFAIFYTPPPYW